MTVIKPNYRDYITSPEWRSKHPIFLKKSRYRCAFSLLRVGKRKHYNCHHMSYENLGDEELWRDVVVLHPWIHKWIIHGILSGFKRPSQQRNYPNLAQQVAHAWCCTPILIRAVWIGLALGYTFANVL